MGRRRRPIAILMLALGGFGIGTTEFVAMGLLNYIAADFQVSEGTAGNVITAYAMGVVIGAPVITAVTGRMPRRRLVILLMVAFTVGNALSVLAGSFGMLMVARFIAGIPHGAFFAAAALIAASMAEPGQRGRAVAQVSMGLSIATLAGVPAAQWIGQVLGWHAAFALVAVIGLVTLAGLWYSVPHMVLMPATNPLTELSALINPQVMLTLLLGAVGFGGMFCVYTYISWTMTERAGFPEAMMWLVLMVYGIGMVLGTYVGGRLADINVEGTILGSLIAMVVMLGAFYFVSTNAFLAIVLFGLVAMSGSVMSLNLQTRLMDVAGDAQNLAASMNHSALNLANAGGAAVGGMVINAGFSYSAPALAGMGMALCGIAVFIPTYLLRRRKDARR
ncbi:MAG: MFS transporter [Mycobacteriaceae bacterium]|uniref:MFS transporter n=1 Tax=Corynebacterium sp. TaxID=1720 RepID=UPI003F9497E3